MKKTILITLFVSVILVACGKNNESGKGNPAPLVSTVGVYTDYESTPQALLDRINERRTINGLVPLVRDPALEATAHIHGLNLADGRGVGYHRTSNICRSVGNRGRCGFQVLSDTAFSGSVVAYWLRKSTRPRFMNAIYNYAGVALTQDRNGKPIWVLVMTSN